MQKLLYALFQVHDIERGAARRRCTGVAATIISMKCSIMESSHERFRLPVGVGTFTTLLIFIHPPRNMLDLDVGHALNNGRERKPV
jgi:hypothetical protein